MLLRMIQNLHKIKAAMETPEFIELMKYLMGRADKYKYKIIGTFKKTFIIIY